MGVVETNLTVIIPSPPAALDYGPINGMNPSFLAQEKVTTFWGCVDAHPYLFFILALIFLMFLSEVIGGIINYCWRKNIHKNK